PADAGDDVGADRHAGRLRRPTGVALRPRARGGHGLLGHARPRRGARRSGVHLHRRPERSRPGHRQPQPASGPRSRVRHPVRRTQLELAWMQSFDGSGAVVPRATYTFAEGVTGEASAYVFYGAGGTEFGGWKDNAQLRLGVAYGF